MQSRQLTARVLTPVPHEALHDVHAPLTNDELQLPVPVGAVAGGADDPDTQPAQPTHANVVLGMSAVHWETKGVKKLPVV